MISAPTWKWCFRVSDVFTESIIAFQPSQKCDLVEVQRAMFKETNYPLYLIFYFLTNRKMDLREVEKMFHVFDWPCYSYTNF
jgi:hypothetical protein